MYKCIIKKEEASIHTHTLTTSKEEEDSKQGHCEYSNKLRAIQCVNLPSLCIHKLLRCILSES